MPPKGYKFNKEEVNEYYKSAKNRSKTHYKKIVDNRTGYIFNNINKILCYHGCGNIAKYITKNGKHLCNKYYTQCPVNIEKNKHGIKDIKRYPHSNETKKLISKSSKMDWEKRKEEGRNFWSEETKIKNSISVKKSWTKERKEKTREYMINGGSSRAASFIRNPSKPQVELFELVKSFCYCATLNYPIIEVNKNIDIAIPFHKIAIEYDGSYWHQDEEKDNERQKQIESLGWKFIRYRDFIPSLEKLKNDITGIIYV